MRIWVIAVVTALVMALSAAKLVAKEPREDRPPVVQAVAPAYPPIAATAGAAGTVVIEVQVKADGAVSSARVLDGIGVLAAAASNSARRWIFASSDAASTRVVRLTFVFKIMPRNTPADELLPIFMPPYRVEVRATVPEARDSVNRDPPMSKQSSRSPKKKP